MSKIKLLLNVVSDMRSLAESLEMMANAMSEPTPEENETKPKTKKFESMPEQESKQDTQKKYTLEEVRGVLSKKSAEGHGNEIRELLTKYGQTRLSDIDPNDYESLLKDAEVL